MLHESKTDCLSFLISIGYAKNTFLPVFLLSISTASQKVE